MTDEGTMTEVVVRLEPCGVCLRDPGFGTLHVGCSRCKKETAPMANQPRLIRVSEAPLVYAIEARW